MRNDVGFVLRHFARDLPWLVAIATVIGAGFTVVPLLLADASVDEALETGAALSIGLAAILPTLWVRYRTIRELGGRRTGIALAMAVAWGALVFLVAWPFLASLDAHLAATG